MISPVPFPAALPHLRARALVGRLLPGVALALFASAAVADYALEASLQYRHFPNEPLDERQHGDNASVAAEPEAYWDWDGRDQSVTVRLFGRLDENDDERSHADVREAFYRYTVRDGEWRVGVRQVFWGVTESAHLVDVINQTDFVEDIDGEVKLGQPMFNFAWFLDIGTVDFYILPVFRERTFPGENGRPRPLLPVEEDAARVDDHGVDFALRYYESFGPLELGLSYFRGTNRDPYYATEYDNCRITAAIPALSPDPLTGTCEEFREAQEAGDIPPNADDFIEELRIDVDNARFVPVYERIDQLGLDMQYIVGALALKAEAIHRSSRTEDFTAAVAGFEYTLHNLFGSGYDLGLLSEYLYDERGLIERDLAVAVNQLSRSGGVTFDSLAESFEFQETTAKTQNAAALQDDLFAGLRLSLNDLAGTEVTLGGIRDLETGAVSASLEASRRFGGNYRVALEGRLFSEVPVVDPLYGFRDDDYLELTITRFF